MKKHAKIFLAIVLTLMMCLTSIPCFAAEADTGISPRLSHMSGGAFSFSALESGGYVDISYEGYPSFVEARVTVKVQKQFLFFFWTDIGEWSATSTEMFGYFGHVFTLDGSGTYRATMTLEVFGNDGTSDVITDTIEDRY